MSAASLPAEYPQFLAQLKTPIRAAQVRAALAVNAELVLLYWRIGTEIGQRQLEQGWGPKLSTGWPPTFGRSFQKPRAFLRATSSI